MAGKLWRQIRLSIGTVEAYEKYYAIRAYIGDREFLFIIRKDESATTSWIDIHYIIGHCQAEFVTTISMADEHVVGLNEFELADYQDLDVAHYVSSLYAQLLRRIERHDHNIDYTCVVSPDEKKHVFIMYEFWCDKSPLSDYLYQFRSNLASNYDLV